MTRKCYIKSIFSLCQIIEFRELCILDINIWTWIYECWLRCGMVIFVMGTPMWQNINNIWINDTLSVICQKYKLCYCTMFHNSFTLFHDVLLCFTVFYYIFYNFVLHLWCVDYMWQHFTNISHYFIIFDNDWT